MVRFSALGALSAVISAHLTSAAATGTVITTCPVKETSGTASNGFPYRVCPGADYQGASAQIIQNVASIAACIQLCAVDTQCVKAVFDTSSNTCHLKSTQDNLVWAVNPRFNSAQIDLATTGTIIATCPYNETAYTAGNGAKFTSCAGTDYQGASRQIVQGIASATACNQLCATTNGCVKAVFDIVNLVCHIKEDQADLIWAVNRQFITIRQNQANQAATLGQWSDIIKLPLIPVAGYVVPQSPAPSRLLFFSSYGINDFGGPTGYTQFADFNYQTKQVSQRQISNTNHDMFCPGISSLADGRIVISGGSNAEVTSIYNPSSNTFTRGPDMKIARGYQTSVTLSNGKIFTIGGSYSGGIGGKNGEIYDPVANTWTLVANADVNQMLTSYDAEGAWRTDNHGWLFGWRNGAVFQAGPSKQMNWYNTTGQGSVTKAGIRDPDNDAMCGVHVMYDTGKIFSAGGTQSYTNSPAFARAFITTIDQPNTPAVVERVADMSSPRAFANTVVLPDGNVLVLGGQRTALVFTDTDPVLSPELFNPVSKTFTKLAPEAVARNYHAIAILLPDATVFQGGGGLCYAPQGTSDAGCNRAVDHPNGQIFSPPYLFTTGGALATRPTISAISAASLRVGSTLTVTTGDTTGTNTFSLIRMGSVTHSVNSDQRRISLTDVKASRATYTIKLPSDSGILIPGYYYLFTVSKAGVPSVARTVQITL